MNGSGNQRAVNRQLRGDVDLSKSIHLFWLETQMSDQLVVDFQKPPLLAVRRNAPLRSAVSNITQKQSVIRKHPGRDDWVPKITTQRLNGFRKPLQMAIHSQ